MSPLSEDELRARLREVTPSPARPAYAEHLIQQARFRRRRQRWVGAFAGAAAVAVIGVGAIVIGDRIGPDEALPARPTPTPTRVETTPTVTSTASPSASVTPTLTTSPTATPSTTTSPPTATPSTSPSPSATPTRSVLLRAVTLLHEGRSDWGEATFESPLCVGDAAVVATPRGTSELRVIDADFVPGANQEEGLAVFASAESAVGYLDDVRRVGLGCNDESSGDVKVIVQELNGPWGDGLALATAQRQLIQGVSRYVGTEVTLFVRVGSAVTFASYGSKEELKDVIPADKVALLRPSVEHVAPQLCRYTAAGC